MVVCEYSRLSLAPATACKTRRETKVSASQRKCTQGLTKRSRKKTQVFLLATTRDSRWPGLRTAHDNKVTQW